MTDLRDVLTVFIITVGGNPNYDDCCKALSHQTCLFKIDTVANFTPMSAAFQKMMDRCETPYYIQVDEDMILNPDAIEKMYKQFPIYNSQIVMDCYQLTDVHMNFPIYGVKIYKTKIFKQFPYENCASCEVNQLDRMEKNGYKYQFKEEIVGLHSLKWTNEGIFERYYNLYMKYRLFGYEWMGRLPQKLLVLHKNDPSELNFYAMSGCFAAMNAPLINEEKDANKHLQAFIDFEEKRKNNG